MVFSLRALLESPEVAPIGMQIEDTDHAWNYYYFNHECPSCGSTFTIPVLDFLPFISEPVPDLVLTGTETCQRHCMKIGDLMECHNACRYAPFRRFLLNLRRERAMPVAPPSDASEGVG